MNLLPTVTVKISTNPVVADYLDDMIRTGLYGQTRAQCAERLIIETLLRELEAGRLERRIYQGRR